MTPPAPAAGPQGAVVDDTDTVQPETSADSDHETQAQTPKNRQGKRTKSKQRASILHTRFEDELPESGQIYTEKDFKNDATDPNFHLEIRDMIVNAKELHTQVELLTHLRNNQEQQIEDLEAQVASLLSQKDVLADEIDAHRRYIQNLELSQRVNRADSPAASVSSRSHKLPDPPVFSGSAEDTLTFEDWIIRINGKLEGNADYFPQETLKLAYVVGRLTGDAARHTAPRLRETSTIRYATVEELLDHLKEIYEDPERKNKARQQFKSLYMRQTDNFHDFYTKFLHLSSEAELNPEELLYELNDKLSFDLRTNVISKYNTQPAPTLVDFARYCTNVDAQLKAIASKRDRSARSNRGTTNLTAALPVRPASRTTTTTATTTSAPASTTTRLPFEESRPQYNDPNRQALSRIGACFHCGKTGHLKKYCPTLGKVASIETTETVDSGNGQS